jgi:hypothetical protein
VWYVVSLSRTLVSSCHVCTEDTTGPGDVEGVRDRCVRRGRAQVDGDAVRPIDRFETQTVPRPGSAREQREITIHQSKIELN